MLSILLVYIHIRVVRRALNPLRASFSPIFQYFPAVNVTRVSLSPVFQYFVTYVCARRGIVLSAMDSSTLNSSSMDSSTIGVGEPERAHLVIQLRLFFYIIIYPCPTSCPKSSTCFFFSDISIFLRRKCYTRFSFSGISIFRNLCMRAPRNCIVGHGFFDLEFVRHGFVNHRCKRAGASPPSHTTAIIFLYI